MEYVGLLTDVQKRAGYFTTQDADSVFLWHRRNGNPDCVAIFLFDDVKLKQIREKADEDRANLLHLSQ